MIQRRQSIYLFIAFALLVAANFAPLLKVKGDLGLLLLYSYGVCSDTISYCAWGVVVITSLAALLSLINIFMYKKRTRQIKIGNITTLLITLLYPTILAYMYSFHAKQIFPFEDISLGCGIFFPVAALIFNFLAISAIKKDEKKVRSLDRIR